MQKCRLAATLQGVSFSYKCDRALATQVQLIRHANTYSGIIWSEWFLPSHRYGKSWRSSTPSVAMLLMASARRDEHLHLYLIVFLTLQLLLRSLRLSPSPFIESSKMLQSKTHKAVSAGIFTAMWIYKEFLQKSNSCDVIVIFSQKAHHLAKETHFTLLWLMNLL